MKRSEVSEFRKNARWIVDNSKIWLWVMLSVAVALFLVHPAPGGYLLVMGLLGALWGGLLTLSWRTEKWSIYLLLIVLVSGTSTLSERLFYLKSQYQNLQGLVLACASAGVLFAVFHERIYRFSRLQAK